MSVNEATTNLTRDDFKTNQDVRWCPGCGDYAILAQVQKVFPELGIPRENFAIVSGIGCSSRFPYYMNTYGFHTIHGRAPAVASGLKLSRPELSVWVVTGDGDALSIGGNHLIHCLRRNVDLKILLFNNQIYGLTKGQYSPTSEFGKMTKSTPFGSVDEPFHPLSLALGSNASFVARSADREPKHLTDVLHRAAQHKGSAFVEVYQNCNIFNDGAFDHVTDKKSKSDVQLVLEHGKPLIFGSNNSKGIVFDGFSPRVVNVADVGIENIAVHDEMAPLSYHMALSNMVWPESPVPMGVLRAITRPAYDSLVNEQISSTIAKRGRGKISELLRTGDTWTVPPR
ncbi:MAG: 2-oxoacid:ferredoxin oxidoreductase subunit beta [Myxococcales bacterium]|nr:2-oxoacid:ferredoxin oxidoreductase subunit beta [Myxococcales bacterium]